VAVNPLDPPVRSLRPVQPPDPSGVSSPSPSQASGSPPDGSAVEDAVNGAFAVLAVAAALVRYVVETTAQGPRTVLSRLPMAGYLPGLPRGLTHPASAAVRALAGMADRLVPQVTRGVLARLDVPALVREYVDLNRLAALLDVEAVVARVDLDAAVDRVDIARVLDRVDLDAAVARVDLDAAVDRVDIARILERVDIDAVVDRADITRVLDRIDLDAVVAKVDLDAAVDRADIARILDRIDLDAVVAKVDLNAAIDRADIARILDRVDIDAVVDRADIARVLDRIDLDAVVAKVDVDAVVDRADVDRVIARTDIAGLARYVVAVIDLPGLLRASSDSVTSDMVRSVRDQGADADRAVERVVDRLLHRHGRRTATTDRTAGPDGPGHTGDHG
jgi:hypothetical protein